MTDSTTTAAESPSVAVTDNPVTEDAPAPRNDDAAKPARRWKTLTLALTAIVALIVGLGVGGVSGWAIANAQRPTFGNGQFPGGAGGGEFQPPADGQFPGNGEAPQRGDGTTDDGTSDDAS